jgi:hypothetical protein
LPGTGTGFSRCLIHVLFARNCLVSKELSKHLNQRKPRSKSNVGYIIYEEISHSKEFSHKLNASCHYNNKQAMLSSGGPPPKLRLACDDCHRVRMFSGQPCDRCHRLKQSCAYSIWDERGKAHETQQKVLVTDDANAKIFRR